MTLSRKKKDENIDSSGWMITFTNLMILLLAFFIVLVNMGVQDQNRKRLALYSLFGAFGLKTGGQAPIGSEDGSDFTLGDSPMTKEEVDYEKLRNIAASSGIGSNIEIKREIGKIVIILSNRIMFDHGKSIITPKSAEYLQEIAPVLKEGPGIIELRGYASKAECLLEPDPDYAGIYLSTKRGLAVLHFLMDKCEIPAGNIVAHGFGILANNKLGHADNMDRFSQVEIIVDYHQKVPYHLRMKKTTENLLDFKGFFFKRPRGHNES